MSVVVRAVFVGALSLFAAAAQAEDKELNIYNWSEYIGHNTIAEFEKATGIHVTYDTYDSDEAVEAKVMAGGASYDIVSTTTSYFGRQIKAGVYLELDKSKLPNWKNLDPDILAAEAKFDPGNAHAAPYFHGTNGFMYNVDKIKARMPDAPVDSLDMLFKPEVVSKFADCGVTLLDAPRDMLQLALAYLKRDPNSNDPADYQAAGEMLAKVRPYIRAFDSIEYLTALPNGDLCLVATWSGDFSLASQRAKAAGLNVHLAYTVPKEGANGWYDAFLIPKGAPHPDAAHKFLNFMMDPKVIAEVTNDLHYANDNAAAQPFVDPAILNDPNFYPTPEMRKRLYLTLMDTNPEIPRLRTRIWTKVKTGY
ncbi:MAG TPA: polyamine ABC transporter substrate-binding protein [Stellaceae bacterium]|nr:polyamine ABC transporter substrate-binding protein [Stellaceae bacterium]